MLMTMYLPLCLSTDYVFTEYSSDEAESGYWDLWNPSNESYDNDLDKKYTITVHYYNQQISLLHYVTSYAHAQVEEGSRIGIQFEEFDLEDEENCGYDSVEGDELFEILYLL